MILKKTRATSYLDEETIFISRNMKVSMSRFRDMHIYSLREWRNCQFEIVPELSFLFGLSRQFFAEI